MMAAVKHSPNDLISKYPFRVNARAALTHDFDHKKPSSVKAFEEKEIETDLESNGSSSEDMENYSPKSVVTKLGKWPATQLKNVDVDVRGVRVHSQVLRIRAEDSHLGEDVGEYLIRNVAAGNHHLTDAASHHVNFMIFSRPASPLSGKAAPSIKFMH